MPSYTVPINGPNGPGFMTVNASSPQAAMQNAGQGGNVATGSAISGGHQATTGAGGTAVALGGIQQQAAAPSGGNNQDILNAFAASSGFSIKQLDEQIREFNAQQALAEKQMQQIGIPQLVINQRLADAQIQFQQSQILMAQANLAEQTREFDQAHALQQQAMALQTASITGMYNGQPTEAAKEFQQSLANQQQQFTQSLAETERQFNQSLAMNYLGQAAQFAATDPFALSDYMRGAGVQTGVPQFLQNLQNNVTGAASGNVGPQATPATTLGDVNTALATGAQLNPQTDPALQAIGGIYTKGASQLGAGTLESLSPTELNTFQQGITRLYGTQAAPAFLAQYQATRPQQTAARAAFY